MTSLDGLCDYLNCKYIYIHIYSQQRAESCIIKSKEQLFSSPPSIFTPGLSWNRNWHLYSQVPGAQTEPLVAIYITFL